HHMVQVESHFSDTFFDMARNPFLYYCSYFFDFYAAFYDDTKLVIEVIDGDDEGSIHELTESINNAFQQLLRILNKEKQEDEQIRNEKLFLEQENE
ncbi:25185_t:CDS:2, partial [Gigaspora rosea]